MFVNHERRDTDSNVMSFSIIKKASFQRYCSRKVGILLTYVFLPKTGPVRLDLKPRLISNLVQMVIVSVIHPQKIKNYENFQLFCKEPGKSILLRGASARK